MSAIRLNVPKDLLPAGSPRLLALGVLAFGLVEVCEAGPAVVDDSVRDYVLWRSDLSDLPTSEDGISILGEGRLLLSDRKSTRLNSSH